MDMLSSSPLYTMFQTHGGNSINSLPIFKNIFHCQILP